MSQRPQSAYRRYAAVWSVCVSWRRQDGTRAAAGGEIHLRFVAIVGGNQSQLAVIGNDNVTCLAFCRRCLLCFV